MATKGESKLFLAAATVLACYLGVDAAGLRGPVLQRHAAPLRLQVRFALTP